ncbi:kinase-like domain-containing protein [Endogone sp. FLAS-F59071]|nr:kinase-like domain-containing protein [Endogone sp. FLAS-F59071]|eukprot:RUS22834.1 kinase-like domain-containing protein [Endogone sp. FLAS-F59071]
MSTSLPLPDAWLPPWTPILLENGKYFHLRTKDLPGFPEDVKKFLEEHQTLSVQGIEQADFVVVDDNIKPTDETYVETLGKVLKLRKPIPVVTARIVKLAISKYDDYHQKCLDNSVDLLEIAQPTNFKVEENQTGDTLKFMLLSNIEGEELYEAVYHEILLRDPNVRKFIKNPCEDLEDLENLVVKDPPRIRGTRWKVEDVLCDYVTEAWQMEKEWTWRWDWDPEEFNKDYKQGDNFLPAKAVEAALLHFFKENRFKVERLLKQPPMEDESYICDSETSQVIQHEGSTRLNEHTSNNIFGSDSGYASFPSAATVEPESQQSRTVKLIPSEDMDDIVDVFQRNELLDEIEEQPGHTTNEEATRIPFQRAILKFERKADYHHWPVHQLPQEKSHMTQEKSLITDLLCSIECEYSKQARESTSHGEFEKTLKELNVEVIDPSEVYSKDVRKPLGRGDTGSVYIAVRNEQKIAIKDFYDMKILLRELRIIRLIEHGSIVQFYGVTRNNLTEKYELVMELASYGNLHDICNSKDRSNITWADQIKMALGLASAIKHIHDKGIVHCNLSCSNVLIRQDLSVALSGFSMSQTVKYSLDDTSLLEDSPLSKETRDYAFSLDIHSLRVMLWEIFSLKPAFANALDQKNRIPEFPVVFDPSWYIGGPSNWLDISEIVEILSQRLDIERRKSDHSRPNAGGLYFFWPDFTRLNIFAYISDAASRGGVQFGLSSVAKYVKQTYDRFFNRYDTDPETTFERIDEEFKKMKFKEIPTEQLVIKKYTHKHGAHSDIHLAEIRETTKEVAVKARVIELARFIQEVETLNILGEHPHIIKFEGISREPSMNLPYIVLERAKCSLQECVHGMGFRNVTLSNRIRLCLGIAKGLNHMHQKQILHCALHSANVLINKHGQPIIADFGLSRPFSNPTITRAEGRVAYIAPELIEARPPFCYKQSHDVYSFGVLMWETLLGESPFKMYGRVRFNPEEDIPDCPPELNALYQACVSKVPSRRPNMEKAVCDLEKIRKKLSITDGFSSR